MFRKFVAAKVLIPTLLTLLVFAEYSHAQPAGPQGTTRFGGGSSSYSGGSGGYSTPSYSGATTPTGTGYQAQFPPEPERNGWQTRSDGWYYYWSRNQLVGAYDPDGEQWYAYDSGWGKAATPPWKRNSK